jgi:hypothetical protein
MKTVLVLCALVALTACQPKQDRYKIITQGPVILKIDTETGQSWRWMPERDPLSQGGGSWQPVTPTP